MEGRPLMASTKIRTGRRKLRPALVEEHGGRDPQGQRRDEGQADLLDGPDDGVGAAARGGRLGRGDAASGRAAKNPSRSAATPLTTM